MSIVTDFKSIRLKVERLEQKADFEEKNPPAWYDMPVCWSPDQGYAVNSSAEPLTLANAPANLSDWPVLTPISPASVNEAARKYMAENARIDWDQGYSTAVPSDAD